MKTHWGLVGVVACCLFVLTACGGAQARRASYVAKGEKFFAVGNFEKARVEFTNALQIDPNDANTRYWVGRTAEKLANPREAVGQYLVAVDKDPKHAQARAALARLYLFGGLPEKSLELVAAGLAQDPNNAALLTVRGAARARLGDMVQALADAEAAFKVSPDDEYTIALLASLYRQSNNNDKAIAVLKKGVANAPASEELRVILADVELGAGQEAAAEADLKKLIEMNPRNVASRYRLARFYMMRKDPVNAEATLRAAVTALPDKAELKLALADQVAGAKGADAARTLLTQFVSQEPKNFELKLALARFYETHGQASEAESTLRSIVKDAEGKPAELSARNRLAALLVQHGDTEGAAAMVKEVLRKNARDNDALILRGNLALASGDAAGAITDLRAVLRDQPTALPVMRALARAHLQNGEVSLAEETLRAAVQANPADETTRLELAQLVIQAGRPTEAKPILEALTAENPANVAAMEALFRMRAVQKDYAGARATALELIRARPDLAEGHYLAALVDESEGKVDDAMRSYERAQNLQPQGIEPMTALVRMEISQKHPERAMARLDKIIEISPQNFAARNLKGELLLAQNRNDEALQAFSSAVEAAPSWWMPYRGQSLALIAAHRPEQAVDALKKGLTATSYDPNLANELATLYERLRRPDDAIKTYETLVERQPHAKGAINNLAMLLVSYRTDKASLEQASGLVQKLANASEPVYLDTRGWVELKRGRVEDALPLLRAAVEKLPQSPAVLYHLGMAQLESGDETNARKNLEAAVAAGTPFLGTEDARATLAKIKRAG